MSIDRDQGSQTVWTSETICVPHRAAIQPVRPKPRFHSLDFLRCCDQLDNCRHVEVMIACHVVSYACS